MDSQRTVMSRAFSDCCLPWFSQKNRISNNALSYVGTQYMLIHSHWELYTKIAELCSGKLYLALQSVKFTWLTPWGKVRLKKLTVPSIVRNCRILWHSNFHYSSYNHLKLASNAGQIYPVHNPSPHFSNILINVIPLSTPRCFKWFAIFTFSHKLSVRISVPLHACSMPNSFHHLWYHQPNNVRWITKQWNASLCRLYSLNLIRPSQILIFSLDSSSPTPWLCVHSFTH